MSIRGSNFENQHPFASDHALVWERCMPDGLLYGVDMSFTSTLFTLGTGFMLVAGRMFEITAAENISISPGSGYARMYVAIDTGGTATENSFDQVSFGVDYAASLDSFAELTQEEININQGAAVYQAEVAVLAINSSGVTAIERQMMLVSPGAGTGAFAAIGVTYPAGSTVTVTDGKITYTAPNTSGGVLFIIPYAATWIVTATEGTATASQTVEITTEGQNVSVVLTYELWLYKRGDQYVDITGGWTANGFSYGSDAVRAGTLQADAMFFNANTSATCYLLCTKNKIQLSNKKSLFVVQKSTSVNVNAISLSVATGTDLKSTRLAQVAATAVTESPTILELDVSAIEDDCYIYVSAFGNNEKARIGYAYEVYIK